VSVLLRIVLGVLGVVAGIIAVVPALVLVDLTAGGNGLGLCPAGLRSCSSGYFTGPELFAMLALALFVVGAAMAGTVRLLRWVDRRRRLSGLR